MISYLRGTLAAFEEDKIIIDVGGVGYGVYVSGQTMDRLPSVGNEVKIHTYLNVKEDAMQLYGFLSRDDLGMFRLLIGVNGIGPKGGLGVLSALSPDDLRFAVLAGDVKAICVAPGIGKKTAEKLILELRDKMKLEDALDHIASEPEGVIQPGTHGRVQSEAIQALVALGYGNTEALRAVKMVEAVESMEVEDVLKQALKNMSL